jgi:hypothetical protein
LARAARTASRQPQSAALAGVKRVKAADTAAMPAPASSEYLKTQLLHLESVSRGKPIRVFQYGTFYFGTGAFASTI